MSQFGPAMGLDDLHAQLQQILQHKQITTLFQPILDLRDGRIHGYEALSRGPSDSSLHVPEALFRAAGHLGLTADLDLACVEAALNNFVARDLPGRVFINLSPTTLLTEEAIIDRLTGLIRAAGIEPRRVVLELTEAAPGFEFAALRHITGSLQALGLRIAMDDLGEGFSSLRLWSELKPTYVKIDKHFIDGIHQDPHKLEFVRSIQQIAEGVGAQLVGEGVELASQLSVVRDLGIRFAQGYFIGRPGVLPARLPSPEAESCLQANRVGVFPGTMANTTGQVRAAALLMEAPSVSPETPAEEVLDLMLANPALDAIAVVDDGRPVGIIHRAVMMDRFIRLYSRELFGRRQCRSFMDPEPLVVDQGTLIHDLSELVVRKGKQAFTSGFIITADGCYAGMGSGFDLMRALTELQIVAARYANPLTGLPGNVPIQQHIERLLAAGAPFVAVYADLNAFKPYNDVYGFRRGDDMIALLGCILVEASQPELDFVGHIGGDDFVVLFQSPDWEARCHRILQRFDESAPQFYSESHRAAGGYTSENRRGELEFHPLVSLALGAVAIDPAGYQSYHEVARAAAEAKHMAKRSASSALFLDRRRGPHAQAT
ncbi:MAG: GGDEF domain-containing protein [Thiobacillaceae bacterium]